MVRPLFAAALLLSSLAACGTQGSGEPATPEETESVAPDAKAVPDVPLKEAPPEVTTSEPEADECGANKLGRWLNLLPTETVKAEIAEAVGHDRIRYIAPGDAITMDLRPDRLNVETGEDGRIKLFRCG